MAKYAGFLLPVVDGHIYLGQRNTEPYKGWFGAIGGKADPAGIWEAPHLIEKMGGHKTLSIADRIAMDEGREFPKTMCIREGYEELYGRPPRIDEPIDSLFLRYVVDPDHDVVCYVTLATLPDAAFAPNARELMSVQKLIDIPVESIFPLTIWALTEIVARHEICTLPARYAHLIGKMPPLPDLDDREANMIAAMWKRSEQRERRGLPPVY